MNGITANQLHKVLSKLIADGHGRKKVCINKDTFGHVLESDGVVIHPVMKISIKWYPLIDEDGGTAMNKDGSEKGFTSLILEGDYVK